MATAYEAGGTGQRLKKWNVSRAGPTASVTANLDTMRSRSRAAAANDPYAGSGISKLVSAVIGTGMRPRPIGDPSFRAAVKQLWDDWEEDADADGVNDIYGVQFLAFKAMLEGGECFIRLRTRRIEDGFAVPLQLQLIEGEQVPVGYDRVLQGGNRIRAGVEFDPRGKRVAYWMLKDHPGEDVVTGGTDAVRVPAEQVIHIFDQARPGAVRGVPKLANVLLKMWNLDALDDATLTKQKINNLFAGFVEKPPIAWDTPSEELDPITGMPVNTDLDGVPSVELEPGAISVLMPGEKITFPTIAGVGADYAAFMRQQLMAVAAGTGVTYEDMTGDYGAVNDRTARIGIMSFRRTVARLRGLFTQQFCRQVWAAFLDAAVLAGTIFAPGYEDPVKRRAYRRVKWVGQGFPYINPLQEAQAKDLEIAAGRMSRDEAITETGGDPEELDAEIAAGKERADSLGLIYSTDQGRENNAKQATDQQQGG